MRLNYGYAAGLLVLGLGFVQCSGLPGSRRGDADEGGTGGTSAGTSGGGTGATGGTGIDIDGGSGTGGGDGGSGGADEGGCGDGIVQPELGEACDDGNSDSGDGCVATCTAKEKDFECPTPGQPCVTTVICGNGLISGTETCDDANQKAGDGCSDTCQLEPGWDCSILGVRCVPVCGDGTLIGLEQCDDGNTTAADGCSASCALEPGWACDPPGVPCHLTTCGDGLKEGLEPCDDGNKQPFDGCSPDCQVEPQCQSGDCISSCGDGLMLPNAGEQCDDGNQRDGDGCSATCQMEPGYTCDDNGEGHPVYIIYRDFIALPNGSAQKHADFEFGPRADTPTPALVQPTLDAAGRPVYSGVCPLATTATGWCTTPCPWGGMVSSVDSFGQWYRDVPGVNLVMPAQALPLVANGVLLEYESTAFFPLDGRGWVQEGSERTGIDDKNAPNRNFGFTSELHYWFQYQGGEEFSFRGDDDVWIFVNGKLALDLGGAHAVFPGPAGIPECSATCVAGCSPPDPGVLKLDALGLVVGNIYEIAMFHAERQSTASNYRVTLKGFTGGSSECQPRCGDGIVAGNETCDCGDSAATSTCGGAFNDGSYGGCNADCSPGPRCGDALVQEAFENCDDGINLTGWTPTLSTTDCAPGCKWPAYCGDGQIDSLFGEKCDDGALNTGDYGQCNPDCSLGPRCGDGIVQKEHEEECDDGNTVSGDNCTPKCKAVIVG